MNNRFDQFIKKALLVCVGVAAISGLLVMSYMDSKDLSFQEIFEDGGFNIHFDRGIIIDDFEDLNLEGRISSTYSRYETKDLYEERAFEVRENIKIISSTEDILFIEESRDDIKVTFEREVPDTSRYNLHYDTRITSDQIVIDVDLRTNGYYAEKDYKGLITVYVPMDYHCNKLTIDSLVASQKISLPKDVDEVDISVDYGSIDLVVQSPLDVLELSLNVGDLYVQTNAPVNVIDLSLDAGELAFDLNDRTGSVKVKNNVGEIRATLVESPTTMEVDCDLGDVKIEFLEPVVTLDVKVSIGDLNIDVASDDKGLVYIDKDLVDFSSNLVTTNKKDKANIFLNVDLGDVEVY